MNKFNQILHNEIASNFKVHEDVNHFELIVKFDLKKELKFDFEKMYSELFDVQYSFNEIITAFKKSNHQTTFDAQSLKNIIAGNFDKIKERDEQATNILKNVYDVIANIENTQSVEILKHIRNFENDMDEVKSFLVGYLNDEHQIGRAHV